MRPAHAVDEADAHPPAERLHLAAPLRRAVVVTHALAGVDQVAAGPPGRGELLVLAAERGGGRLVEAAHAVVDPALVDEREPLGRQAEHLQVDDAQVGAQPPRPRAEPLGLGRVVAEHEVRPERRQPAVLRCRIEAAEDALGALEPPIGHRCGAVELEMVVADPQRHPRRAPEVSVRAVQLDRTARAPRGRAPRRRATTPPTSGPPTRRRTGRAPGRRRTRRAPAPRRRGRAPRAPRRGGPSPWARDKPTACRQLV